ncbi:MAG: VWA domain-containing protein [Actinomycetota bacterium]
MISGLCGFAELVRRNQGHVGAAELIDVARAFTLIDLADRAAVHHALKVGLSWATVNPDGFDELFALWFSGNALDAIEDDVVDADDLATVALDTDTIDAARIHTDEAVAIEQAEADADGATNDDGLQGSTTTPAQAHIDGGQEVTSHGDLAMAPPTDETGETQVREADVVVALPEAPPDTSLELAREVLTTALERRRNASGLSFAANRVTALTQPLTRTERDHLNRCVRRLNRELNGSSSWRRRQAPYGTIDLRRTMRRTVTAAGMPIDVRRLGRRHDAARLVVLVDVSLSVRGTSRLVLHLVHRLRSAVGSLRSFGFVDTFVPIDRALRTADSTRAIEAVLGAVDVQAASDPGRALRAWWSRWHYLVSPETQVVILSDGRCNGRDPAFETVRKITAQSAATLWISPEPAGAWRLGRGEMVGYAAAVDRAVTVRSVDDLEAIALGPASGRRVARAG